MSDHVAQLVERGDLDGLLRAIDDLAGDRAYDAVVELAQRCTRAVERGKQLWAAAEHAYYRTALHGPAELAAHAIEQSEGRFGLGPLTEVVAQHHTWTELRPFLPDVSPLTATVAHERCLRGDDIGDRPDLAEIAGVPLSLARWEPRYFCPTYREYTLDDEAPVLPPRDELVLPIRRPDPADDPTVCTALAELTRHWAAQSNGRVQTSAVSGNAAEAIAALGVRRARGAELAPRQALALMAWAAASSGAVGRRRGGAAGRFDTWWAACALADLDWPAQPDELGEALGALRWWVWDAYEPAGGWRLQLAVDDELAGCAWALSAVDAA